LVGTRRRPEGSRFSRRHRKPGFCPFPRPPGQAIRVSLRHAAPSAPVQIELEKQRRPGAPIETGDDRRRDKGWLAVRQTNGIWAKWPEPGRREAMRFLRPFRGDRVPGLPPGGKARRALTRCRFSIRPPRPHEPRAGTDQQPRRGLWPPGQAVRRNCSSLPISALSGQWSRKPRPRWTPQPLRRRKRA